MSVEKTLPLGQLLLEAGIITQKQINVALSVQKAKHAYLGEILQQLDFVTASEIAKAIANQQNIQYVDVEQVVVDKEILERVPKELAQSKRVLPWYINEGVLIVIADDIHDIVTLDQLKKVTNLPISFAIADREKLVNIIELHYYQLENPLEERIEHLIAKHVNNNEIDVVLLLDLFLHNAIKDRATDVHITPDKEVVHLFYRIDGVLQHYFAFEKSLHAQMVARIKIMANLDIAKQRLPQDGAFEHTFLEQTYDMRVSTLPTNLGENVVLRILSRSSTLFNLKSLGLDKNTYENLQGYFQKPYGMILVTGPTGSGKTTTLYSALREIDSLSKSVLTVEDPIEYRFSFIKQTQINEKSGYTFSTAIKHFMRQDPDVMLVGEIRDDETARLAYRASITGHLVLSTLHANNAVATIPRLIDMGVERDLISTALLAVIAQRLVRKVCSHCAVKTSYSDSVLKEKGFTQVVLNATNKRTILNANPEGCSVCQHTGYLGRTAIVEVFEINETIKDMISKEVSTVAMMKHMHEKGMLTLKDNGFLKVLEGITTIEEVERVTI